MLRSFAEKKTCAKRKKMGGGKVYKYSGKKKDEE